ncbi:alpha-mannosidase [Leptolyngbya sp. GGD]|uniref:alpha-mannosidase n=1 Tax=Leptolyngbya sp. GGD TaxID=2997907 RepID=UPI00227A0FCF|nr:alpha-mannosidase [Leptolyngbya sp. GGD]MCY6492177.1 alpha-mannosidase [Leptolyngbya sp. GGD]
MVEFVTSFIERLRNLVQADAIEHWLVCETDCTIADLSTQSFTKLELNEKRYLVWEKGRKVRWFYQEFSVPEDLAGYPLEGLTLRLALTWWAELAEVFVNGQKVQEGDLFDHSCRIVLSSATVPGEKIAVAIRLVSPGHDIGGLMRSRLIYESNYDEIDPGFVADELEVIQSYVEAFELDKLEFELDWQVSNRSQFHQSLEVLRNSLLPFSTQIKQHTIYLLGHAHLDMAWLWDVEETWRAAERTFVSVLNLQKDFPELTFCHTTPALFEWVEQNRPELFAQIQAQVKAGTWEIVGGMWVEPEMNLINAESIARHLLYGQRYCQEKFGEICRVAWLPDTFGFNWQTPQFLKLAGIDYFVTQKLRWNDTTRFPYEWFNWQAPDGSQVKSLMSSPIGEGIDPIKMAQFAWDWVKKTGQPHALWLFGVGDHGGGPTRDMLEIAERWKRSPFFPKLEFTTALKYLESLEAPKDAWNDELYLEFHRGCYTTHGDQKSFNRWLESLLKETELWSAFAAITKDESYPKLDMEDIWKAVLFNQFHDILPGTSIREVFETAVETWEYESYNCMELDVVARRLLSGCVRVSNLPHLEAKLIIVFNPSNWRRDQFISVKPLHENIAFTDTDKNRLHWQVADLEGNWLEEQNHFYSSSDIQSYEITFLAKDIPGIGYRCFWLCPLETEAEILPELPKSSILENQFLRVTVNLETGNLDSIFDKQNQREILSEPGNQLQAFQDEGQYWDAWNIDPKYSDYALSSPKLIEVKLGETHLSNGCYRPLRAFRSQISVTRQIGESTFEQIYILGQDSPFLEIHNFVDWRERHVLVKAAFPLNIESSSATYEIAAGAIDRTTIPQTKAEKAKWEVSALSWADLSDENYGVSILSESKHGYDCTSNQIRLTLLRGSEFPDPEADLGYCEFSYAIYPHAGNWKEAQTVRKAAEFCNPMQAIVLDKIPENGTLPPVHSFLDLGADNLILSSLKQSEDNRGEYILRCYECHGEPAELNLKGDFEIVESVDLLERPINTPNKIEPWQIRSYRIRRKA